MDNGPVNPHCKRPLDEVYELLNAALASKIICLPRRKQLGGVPNLDPRGIDRRAFSSFESGHTLADLFSEDLLAERVVIKIYGDVVKFFGDADPLSRRMFEDILNDEEDHADEIADLIYTVGPQTGKTVEQFTGDSTSKQLKGS